MKRMDSEFKSNIYMSKNELTNNQGIEYIEKILQKHIIWWN